MSTEDKRIRELAHQIWESEGKPHGEDARHWEMARKLAEAEALTPSKPKAPTKPKAAPKPKPAPAKPAAEKKPKAPRKPAPTGVSQSELDHSLTLSRHGRVRPEKTPLQEHFNEQTRQKPSDAEQRAVADS